SQGIQLLCHAIASDAFYNSAERYPQPKCHPETRTKMLEDLWSWSSEKDPGSSVLWLYGPAGAGKSAIAQSFLRNAEDEGWPRGQLFLQAWTFISRKRKQAIPYDCVPA
ncbi:hypothetical protein B0H14DRAFT_2379428, partial [Mycena olivaceomarginata]